MDKGNKKRSEYRKYVEADLESRHIKETVATLIWLRVQKMQSMDVKVTALEQVQMEIEVLDKMICEKGGESI